MSERHKKGVTLSLNSDQGKELLRQWFVCGRALEIFRLHNGPARRRYAVLRNSTPADLYATGTGLHFRPDRTILAWTFTIQAASGIMSVHGDLSGPPMKAVRRVDFMGGVHLSPGDDSVYQRMAPVWANWSKSRCRRRFIDACPSYDYIAAPAIRRPCRDAPGRTEQRPLTTRFRPLTAMSPSTL